MYLKRLFDHSSGTPVVMCVQILHAGPRQKFWPSLIKRGVAENWLTVMDDRFVIHAEAEDVEYFIERRPDKDDPNFHCVRK